MRIIPSAPPSSPTHTEAEELEPFDQITGPAPGSGGGTASSAGGGGEGV